MKTDLHNILELLTENKNESGMLKIEKLSIRDIKMSTFPALRTPCFGGQYIDTVWRFIAEEPCKRQWSEDIRYLMDRNCKLLFKDHHLFGHLKSWNVVPSFGFQMVVDFYIDIKELLEYKIQTYEICRFDLLDI